MGENDVMIVRLEEEFRSVRQVIESWWNKTAGNPLGDLIVSLHCSLTGRRPLPDNPIDQAESCRRICQVMVETSKSCQRQNTFENDVYQALSKACDKNNGSTISPDGPINPFQALATIDSAYFAPWSELPELAERVWTMKYGSSPSEGEKAAALNLLGQLLAIGVPLGVFQLCGFDEVCLKITKDGSWITGQTEPARARFSPYLHTAFPYKNGQAVSADYVVATYGIVSSIVSQQRADRPLRLFEAGVGSWRQLAVMAVQFPEAQLFGCDSFDNFCQPPYGIDQLNAAAPKLRLIDRIKVQPGNILDTGGRHFNDNGPYDLIHVTCMLPFGFNCQPLIDNLTDGGILIVPLAATTGNSFQGPLTAWRRNGGTVEQCSLADSQFVPAQALQEKA